MEKNDNKRLCNMGKINFYENFLQKANDGINLTTSEICKITGYEIQIFKFFM